MTETDSTDQPADCACGHDDDRHDAKSGCIECRCRPAALPDVVGRCPACGGQSLFLADGGYVTCSRVDCPQPDAAHEAIEERAGANAYDRAINAPMSEAAAAELRRRLADGTAPRRKVRRREPAPECTASCSEQHTYTDGCAAGYCPHCGRGDCAPTADEYEQQRQRAETAETALAALHEGELPRVDPIPEITPPQWIWLWNRATPEERLAAAEQAIDTGECAYRCFVMNHKALEGRLTALKRAHAALAEQAGKDQRAAAQFQTRLDAAREWARHNLPAEQRDELLARLGGKAPATDSGLRP